MRSGITLSRIPTSANFRSVRKAGTESDGASVRQPSGNSDSFCFVLRIPIDAEPDTEDQVRPLELTENMGYLAIGDKIDPNDWRKVAQRRADRQLCV